jgi:hypothetical protein
LWLLPAAAIGLRWNASLLAVVALVASLLAGVCAGDRLGWGSALRLAIRRNPAWTAGFGGFRGFDLLRALAVGPRSTSSRADRRLPPASRGARLRSEPQPTLPRHHLGEWRKTFAVFKRCFGIDGPSSPRRCPRPTRWQGTEPDAKTRIDRPTLLVVPDDRGAFGAARWSWRCTMAQLTDVQCKTREQALKQ